jgi:phosphate:Na+ symporter
MPPAAALLTSATVGIAGLASLPRRAFALQFAAHRQSRKAAPIVEEWLSFYNSGMTTTQLLFLIFAIAGGLALFIYGMNVMSDALRLAAGATLRTMLTRATDQRWLGLLMGTALSTLIQSSATTVMLVGFINAGLMTLAQSIVPILGANIGTTLSMQLISIRLSDYCLLMIAVGLFTEMVVPRPQIKQIGRVVLGFGLIFLGMDTMSGAIQPHRQVFARLLLGIHGTTYGNILLGYAIALMVTGVIQSSGAVVGMCFALTRAGVYTDIHQVFPIVLGAQVGTCATAMLGSIGTNINARRSAIAHLTFNILNTLLVISIHPLYLKVAVWSSGDLVHQIANFHTLVMLVGSALVYPLAAQYARFIVWLVPSKTPAPEPSYLDRTLCDYPEKALCAAIRELQRVTRICAQSLKLTYTLIFTERARDLQRVRVNERVVDDIKAAMKDYLLTLTRRTLSQRQALLLQTINRCVADIERIGDHIDELADITMRRHKHASGSFSRELLTLLADLYERTAGVLHLVVQSLDAEHTNFQAQAEAILHARNTYVAASMRAKESMTEKVVLHQILPVTGVFFSEYVAALDRIVKHAKLVALAEKQPYFLIKRRKLERAAQEAPDPELPPQVDPQDFMDQLHWENYL